MKLYFVNSNNVKKNVNLVLFPVLFERFYCYVCIILKSFVTDILEAAFCFIKQIDFCQINKAYLCVCILTILKHFKVYQCPEMWQNRKKPIKMIKVNNNKDI